MCRFLLVVLPLALWVESSFSQFLITGSILTQPGKNPIAYANIGIPNTIVGTISNPNGSFSIKIPPEFTNDTLHFSAIGYGKRNVPIQFLNTHRNAIIYLAEQVTTLAPITITAKREKSKSFELGNRYFRGGIVQADSVYAGATYTLLIENKFPSYHAELAFPAYLQKTRLRILKNNFKQFKFRVRLFDVDSVTGEPGRDLFTESIVEESAIRKGWIEVDLSRLNFAVNGPFFIGYEWILSDEDRRAIVKGFQEFRKIHPDRITTDTVLMDGKKHARENIHWADFPGTGISVSPLQFSRDHFKSYTRESSFAKWKRTNAILTARVTLGDTPSEIKAQKNAIKKTEAPCKEDNTTCHVVQLCQDFLDENSVNGIQLCVTVNGNTKFSQAFGLADVDNNQLVTTATRFRVGSVSKSLTSAALVKLVSDGKLDLDAPVQKYTPFPQKKYSITTRQLAGHLAGIRHYRENDPGDLTRTDHYKNATDALRVFKNDSLLFRPGAQFCYSSYGWNLIGAVIEGASGQSYLKFMDEKIWKPLNMVGTYGDVADSLMPDRSKFYDVTGEQAGSEDLSYKYPGGGLLSTAHDLAKYGNELLHPRYLDPSVTKTLFETQYTSPKNATGYGLGWYIGTDKNGHRIWFHAGDLLNSSAYLILYPDDDIVVAFVANSQEGLHFEIQKIGELFYKR